MDERARGAAVIRAAGAESTIERCDPHCAQIDSIVCPFARPIAMEASGTMGGIPGHTEPA